MSETVVYSVPGMSCGHCVQAVEAGLASVAGVERAEADLDTKIVRVTGGGLDDRAQRAAIAEAGYEVA